MTTPRPLSPGDRVRCVDASATSGILQEGKGYTVTATSDYHRFGLLGIAPYQWRASRFERIEP